MATPTKTPTAAAVAAKAFVDKATEAGFTVTVKKFPDAVVTIETTFTPGDRDAFVAADGTGPMLMLDVPTVTYGTTWGTDGGGVGGHAGMTGGYYRLNKSGVAKRFANAVAAMTGGAR